MIDPPDFLALDPTGLCNYRCTTCVLDRRYPEPTLLEQPVLEALGEVMPGLGGMALGCDAEPTLHPRLPEIVRFVRERMPGRLMMITNGSRLDEARAAAWLDAGVDDLAVSLDGATAATFEGVRLRARFDEVVGNLRSLAERVRRDGRPVLRVIFTTLRRNVHELPAVVELAASLGIRHVSVNGFEPYTSPELGERLWRRPGEPVDVEPARVAHRRASERARELGVELKLPELEVGAVTSCPFATPVVGPAGVVSPCPALSYEREVPLTVDPVRYRRRVYGTLPARSFGEIWEDADYVAFRRQAADGLDDEACRDCLVASGAICARQ